MYLNLKNCLKKIIELLMDKFIKTGSRIILKGYPATHKPNFDDIPHYISFEHRDEFVVEEIDDKFTYVYQKVKSDKDLFMEYEGIKKN